MSGGSARAKDEDKGDDVGSVTIFVPGKTLALTYDVLLRSDTASSAFSLPSAPLNVARGHRAGSGGFCPYTAYVLEALESQPGGQLPNSPPPPTPTPPLLLLGLKGPQPVYPGATGILTPDEKGAVPSDGVARLLLGKNSEAARAVQGHVSLHPTTALRGGEGVATRVCNPEGEYKGFIAIFPASGILGGGNGGAQPQDGDSASAHYGGGRAARGASSSPSRPTHHRERDRERDGSESPSGGGRKPLRDDVASPSAGGGGGGGGKRRSSPSPSSPSGGKGGGGGGGFRHALLPEERCCEFKNSCSGRSSCRREAHVGDAGFVPLLCRHGRECRHHKEGRCNFYHEDELDGLERRGVDPLVIQGLREALAYHPSDAVLREWRHRINMNDQFMAWFENVWRDLAQRHARTPGGLKPGEWEEYHDKVLAGRERLGGGGDDSANRYGPAPSSRSLSQSPSATGGGSGGGFKRGRSRSRSRSRGGKGGGGGGGASPPRKKHSTSGRGRSRSRSRSRSRGGGRSGGRHGHGARGRSGSRSASPSRGGGGGEAERDGNVLTDREAYFVMQGMLMGSQLIQAGEPVDGLVFREGDRWDDAAHPVMRAVARARQRIAAQQQQQVQQGQGVGAMGMMGGGGMMQQPMQANPAAFQAAVAQAMAQMISGGGGMMGMGQPQGGGLFQYQQQGGQHGGQQGQGGGGQQQGGHDDFINRFNTLG